MGHCLSVQAKVIDVRSDTPQENDSFLVDTNVWLWQTYSNANVNQFTRIYSSYLKRASVQRATLLYSGLILAELAHVIEKTERDIYVQLEGHKNLKTKEYRHNNPTQRSKVVEEVKSSWSQVKQLATSVNLTVNQVSTDSVLSRFETQALDGYDLFLLESITQAKFRPAQVITDDSDYAVVPDIQLFTANKNTIRQARSQGKLINR